MKILGKALAITTTLTFLCYPLHRHHSIRLQSRPRQICLYRFRRRIRSHHRRHEHEINL